MNVTLDRNALLKSFKFLKADRDPENQWLRLTAVAEHLVCESGGGSVTLSALVLEPGAFTTRRETFARLLRTLKGTATVTLQADAGRFRIGAFSGQLLDYDSAPILPEGFDPDETGE